jgi:hypothetical protein
MKKKRNKKIWFLSAFFLFLIGINLFFVSAQNFFDDYIVKTDFYQAIRPYVIPEIGEYAIAPNIGEFSSLIIGLISLIILFVVIYDIFTLIPVFSVNTMRTIAIGFGIIMILFKLNVFFASWLFSWGVVIFAWAGSLAVLAVIIFAIFILIALIFGGGWIVEHIQAIRDARQNLEKKSRATDAGGDIAALRAEAKAASKG